jgi:ATP-dependent 26S proteasome regulatory subunit
MSHTVQDIIKSIINDDTFGWILLTGSSTVRNIAIDAVQNTISETVYTTEFSILTPPRRGETWTDIALDSILRDAVKHATIYKKTDDHKIVRVAIVYLWQLTDLFVSKRSSENWQSHICVEDSDRTIRKLTQCHLQLKKIQKRYNIRIVVIATVTNRNATKDISSLLPTKVRSCFRYHLPILTKINAEIIPATSNNSISMNTLTSNNTTTLDWGAVVGMENVKQTLLEAVVWSRTKKHIFKRLGVHPSKGILLYGPPGTGKTLVARTVATKANVYFLSMSFADIVKSGVGESEAAIALAFEQARRHSPSILFIDEIQALFSEKKTAGQVAKKMISQLLQEMDGLTEKDDDEKHVIVLAATNLPQCLDPALLRPGRFDKLIHVGLPNFNDRMKLFRNLLHRQDCEMTIDEENELCQFIGKFGEQLTGAEIENVYRIAIGKGINEETDNKNVSSRIVRQLSLNNIEKAIHVVRTTRRSSTKLIN